MAFADSSILLNFLAFTYYMDTLFDETLKRSAIDLSGKHLKITQDTIQYGDKEIRCAEITEVSETLNAITVQGLGSGDTYTIELKDRNGKKIEFGMSSFLNATDPEGVYVRLHRALKEAVYNRLLSEMEKSIDSGGEVKKGQVMVRKEGLEIERGLIFKAKDKILWADLATRIHNGNLELRSRTQPKVSGQIMLHWWNAIIVKDLIEKRAGAQA